MAEHLIHVNNWFSKSETDRAEQMHYSVFKPSESTSIMPSMDEIDTQGSNTKESEKVNAPLPATTSDKHTEVAKSIIVFDIKPWDDETDIDAMEQAVRSIEADGLLWGQSKRVPVAFGINKLEIGCVIEDDKIGTDFLEETICEFDDYVQSVDIVSFTKN